MTVDLRHNVGLHRLLSTIFLLHCHLPLVFSQNGVMPFCTSPNAQGNIIFIKNITEDAAVDSVLYQLNVIGDDSEISLNLPSNEKFSLNSERQLILTQTLSVTDDQSALFEANVTCRILSTNQQLELRLILLVNDINNHPPVFQTSTYNITVNEMTLPGSLLISDIIATDDDPSDKMYLKYTLAEGDYNFHFNLSVISNPTARASLLLERALNYEEIKLITLRVVVTDGQNYPTVQPRFTAFATIIVNVEDADDQNPAFERQSYSCVVTENITTSTHLPLNIRAVDQDTAINSPLQYSIVDDESGIDDVLVINEVTGKLNFKDSNNVIGASTYVFMVQATEISNSNRYARAMVRVTVSVDNIHQPRFSKKVYLETVAENSPVNTLVVQLIAFDVDPGQSLLYEMDILPDMKTFTINQRTGEIRTGELLDFEQLPEYRFTVNVDDGTYRDRAMLVIRIADVNDNDPVFQQSKYVFNVTDTTLVGIVKATDKDSSDTITYTLQDESGYFSINEVTGQIYVLQSAVQNFTTNIYVVVVTATDTGSPPRSASVIIHIITPTTTTEPTAAAVGSTRDNDYITGIIIIAVFATILLVIIVLLLVYIQRRISADESNKGDSKIYPSATTDRRTPDSLSSRHSSSNPYLAYDSPKSDHGHNGTVTRSLDHGSTSIQHSPFMPDEHGSRSFNSESKRNGTRPKLYTKNGSTNKDPFANNSLRSVQGSIASRYKFDCGQLEYETSVAPMEDVYESKTYENMLPIEGAGAEAPMVTFKSPMDCDSTETLVPKNKTKNRVSFMDNYNMDSSQETVTSSTLAIPPPSQPEGITVYY